MKRENWRKNCIFTGLLQKRFCLLKELYCLVDIFKKINCIKIFSMLHSDFLMTAIVMSYSNPKLHMIADIRDLLLS